MAAFFAEHSSFDLATAFLQCRTGNDPAVLCRSVELSYLRLIATPALHRAYHATTTTNRDAIGALTELLMREEIGFLSFEPRGVHELGLRLGALPSASPKVWMSAHLAAIATRAGLPFATLDSDFRRFESAGLQLCLLTG